MDLQEVRDRRGGGLDWIDLAQGRDKWQALVNADSDTGNITHRSHCVLLPDVFHG
jgi:hypothetical protein